MKYKLTKETTEVCGNTLRRIQALKDFSIIKKGDLGGWVQSERNLSQEENCWIFGNAMVSGNARVYEDAQVFGGAWVHENAQLYENARVYDGVQVSKNAQVFGNARVYGDAWVHGNARVHENAQVFGNASVYEDARVSGNAQVFGNARVFGDAQVFGDARARVYGNVWVSGNAKIESTKDYLIIGPIGGNRFITATKSNKMITAGCFLGSLEQFKERVDQKYKGEGDYYWFIPALEKYFE